MTRALLPRWGLPQFLMMGLVSIAMVATTPGFLQATNSLMSAGQTLWSTSFLDANSVQPFVLPVSDPVERERAIDCLAEAVFYEAGFEPREGQQAVAQVVVNRVRDPNFPASICGVVYEGFSRKTGCQFSFVCDNSMFRRPPTEEQWLESKQVAEMAVSGFVLPEVGAATHYHADYVNPYWRPSLHEVTKVGTHIFYTWRGRAGEPSALRQPYEGGDVEIQQAAYAVLSDRAA